MSNTSDVERAERISRSRARLFAAQALLFITWQGLFFSEPVEETMRTVSIVKLSAWVVWVLALLMLLATGGGFLRSKSIRRLLNDELTRANRARAYAAGFWAAMASALGLFVLNLFEAVSAREAIHTILSAAIAAAFITFAVRERRSAHAG